MAAAAAVVVTDVTGIVAGMVTGGAAMVTGIAAMVAIVTGGMSTGES